MFLALIQLPWIVVLSYIIAKGCGLSVELPSFRGLDLLRPLTWLTQFVRYCA